MRRIGLSTLVLALTVFGGLGLTPAQADPISYWTSGSVNGPSGTTPLTFDGVSGGTFTLPGVFSLGHFETAINIPDSASLTYNNTPFTVDVHFTTSSGTSTLEIQGLVNGTLTGNTLSSLLATVTSVTQVGGGDLPFPLSSLTILAPQSIGSNTSSPLYAFSTFDPNHVPEPTTLALCGMVLAGLGVRQWRRSVA